MIIIFDMFETVIDNVTIGDTYKTDVCGAYQAGLKVVWINRNKETDVNGFATYQIRDITELNKYIEP